MPKLLSEVKTGATQVFTPAAILNNEHLAALLGVVSNAWTNLEMELGETLSRFLHTQPETGLAIYEAITSVQLKQSIVMQAARTAKPHLDETELKVLAVLLSLTKECYDERNETEHDMWGTSLDDELTTVLLRVPTRHILEHNLIERQYLAHRQNALEVPNPWFDPSLIEVWSEADLTALIAKMNNLAISFQAFRYWLRREDPIRVRWHALLCAEPRIRTILDPSSVDSENSAKSPPRTPPKDRRVGKPDRRRK